MILKVDDSPFATLSSTRRQLLAGRASPSDVLEYFLEAIRQRDKALKAWCVLNEEPVRAQAKRLDRQMSRIEETSPLFGIPYGAKDIFHTRGLPTEAGSRVLAGFIPADNACVIDTLEAAGALLLGKTTTTEFANLGTPPQTGNAWNSAHTPGGSSSGSAAALAGRMALMTLGTQTAGSLSRPAAYNGITVLKATYGRVSKAGVIPASWSLDHVGAFTHSVEDAVLVYNLLSGADPRDAATLGRTWQPLQLRRKIDYTIGIVDDAWFSDTDDDIAAACEQAVRQLEQFGIRFKTVRMPASFMPANAAHRIVMQAECASYHRDNFLRMPERFGQYLQEFLAEGLQISTHDYIQAQCARARYQCEMQALFGDVDALLTPATATPAPGGLAATGSPAYNMPFTNAGVPTLTLPVGFSPRQLPVAMQLIAAHNNEQSLIDIGLAYQQATEWHRYLPPLCAA